METSVIGANQGFDILAADQVIANNYIVIECLGVGKRATVYRCRHKFIQNGSELAIKILHHSFVSDENVVRRFEREVVASYEVTHPNIIRSFEYIHADDAVGFSMEYAPGGNLRRRIQSQGRFGIEEALQICIALCSGLEAIHEAGIVHRDIKPGNILFSKNGTVKISDFGIALATDGPRLTMDGEVLGTVGYASPEYLSTGKVDSRSDLYAVGLLAYEMIAGHFPFPGSNPIESLQDRMNKDAKPLHLVRPDCPEDFSAVIHKAMHRNPNQRFESAKEMMFALRAVSLQSPATSTMVLPDTRLSSVQEAVQAVRELTESTGSAAAATASSNRKASRFAFIALFVTCAIAGGLFLPKFMNSSQEDSQALLSALDTQDSAVQNKAVQQKAPKKAMAAKTQNKKSSKTAVAKVASSTKTKATSKNQAASIEKQAEIVLSELKLDKSSKAKIAKTKQPKVEPNKLAMAALSKDKPKAKKKVANTAAKPNKLASAPKESKKQKDSYRISKGDTVTDLADRFGLTPEEIIYANQLQNPDLILEGETLTVPNSGQVPESELVQIRARLAVSAMQKVQNESDELDPIEYLETFEEGPKQ